MKIIITPEKIIFDYLFYSIIIPRDNAIQYSFPMEIADSIGHPPAMIIVSENKQIKYKFGFIGRLMYWLQEFFINSTEATVIYGMNELTMVRAKTLSREASLNKIKDTLQSLKANGYEVAGAEAELQKIIITGPNKKLQEGTAEWRLDKLKLFRNIILATVGIFIVFYWQGDFNNNDGFIIVPIFVFGIIIFISLITIFARIKNFLWILFFIIFALVILLSILD